MSKKAARAVGFEGDNTIKGGREWPGLRKLPK